MAKILVVEDDPRVREIICEILQPKGFELFEAEDGLLGVQRAKEKLPDLIICDIMMPNLDGYGVLEQLQRQSSTREIGFIFLTAKSGKVNYREGIELGADDYLTKPFTMAELLGAVSIRLKKQRRIKQDAEKKVSQLRHNLTLSLPHELLTPLNGIMGNADLLKLECDEITPDGILGMANDIKMSAVRLHRSIQNFLLYAKLEMVSTNPEQADELLQGETPSTQETIQAAARQQAKTSNRSADLNLALHESSLPLADKWLSKMANELINNAFKFSSKGTQVDVTSQHDEDTFLLQVCDRGRGMTAEQIANVAACIQFDRKLYEHQGSGLGLALSRRLVELAGGALEIESVPRKQTTVRLSLPLQ